MEFGQGSEEHTKIAELSRKIGQILVERGDYEQAMHQFQLGLQYLEGIEHKELVRIYNEMGRVYWEQGKLEEAQAWTDKAFDLAERLLDPDELARLLLYAGIRYRRQGANKLAEEYWLHSLEISKETGDLVMQARLYQNLGWQSQAMGNYPLALERLEKGRALAEQCGDTSSLSFIHETLGETYYALGAWDKAIENFQQSLNYAEQAGERRVTSRVFSFLGDIYRNQGRWTEADESYQRALAAITGTGTPQSLVIINLSLGLINMERKRYAKAKEFFDKCWAITSRGAGYTSRMAMVKTAMAELAIHAETINEAEEHIKEAIRLAKEADAYQELAIATMVKGIIATQKQDWNKATELLHYAKQAFDELGDKHNQGRVHAEFGVMYYHRNQGPQDREQAKKHISQARTIFVQLGAKNDLEKLPVIDG
jgi:tetratricopeptide (TPR) repeat protein